MLDSQAQGVGGHVYLPTGRTRRRCGERRCRGLILSFDNRENNKQICRPTGTPSLAPQFVMARVPSSWWTHVNYWLDGFLFKFNQWSRIKQMIHILHSIEADYDRTRLRNIAFVISINKKKTNKRKDQKYSSTKHTRMPSAQSWSHLLFFFFLSWNPDLFYRTYSTQTFRACMADHSAFHALFNGRCCCDHGHSTILSLHILLPTYERKNQLI